MSDGVTDDGVPGDGEHVSTDRAVEEGMLIAMSALTMDVKNAIIIDAIRDGRPFEIDRVREVVRAELHSLAEENDQNRERVKTLSEQVLTPRGTINDNENYQKDDHDALARRAIIHDRMADALEQLRDDEVFVDDVIETARAEALAEVGDAISARLLKPTPRSSDPFYEDDKDARIKALISINLKSLERAAKKRHHHR